MTRARAKVGRLHVITDVSVQNRFTHEQLAALAAAGGADVIQFRDKRMSDSARVETATRIQELCERFGAALIVNDSIDVARDAGADGVHLGRNDAPVDVARDVLGPRAIIGATAGNLEEALAAQEAGADYIGFGHIFPTTSKAKPTPPVGIDGLRRVCEALTIPVIAIGGIDETTAGEVVEAGAHGIAVIAAVCAADDPAEAARRLRLRIG